VWWFYNTWLWLGVLAGFPLSTFSPKVRYYFYYRLGRTLKEDSLPFLGKARPVWFHALSVGEVLSVVPLVKEFCKRWPDIPVFLTTSTMTGHEIALRQLKDTVTAISCFPLDLSPIINHYFKRVNPRVIVLTETDIWPNFLKATKDKKIPCLLVNARISDRSYKRYKLVKVWIKEIINCLSFVGAQRQEDAERFLQLGLRKEKLKIVGNLKFDKTLPKINKTIISNVKTALGILPKQPVWVAGSTHHGEDEVVLRAHKALLNHYPERCLVIAPRHPERFDEVSKLALNMGLCAKRRSEHEEGKWEVIILDTLGELAKIYAIADLVFIGGSFVPIGGHNPLEAALWAKPVIFGPYMFNFSEIAETMLKVGAAKQVKDRNDFLKSCFNFFEDPLAASNMGKRGRLLVKNNQGVVNGYLKIIESYL
jgi:3-deoxy-D-manno-octulosonic-acid transferase